MKNRFPYLLIPALLAVLFSACNYTGGTVAKHPISLGDSASIITEGDSDNLRDLVKDFNPNIPAANPEAADDTTAKAQAENPQPATAEPGPAATEKAKQIAAVTQPAPPASGKGLTVPFNEVTVFIPDIVTKAPRGNPIRNNGATYQMVSGYLNGDKLQVNNSSITRISQRYQTTVVLTNDDGDAMPIDALSSTTDWQPIKGSGNNYPITGLDSKHLQRPQASANEIRRGVERAMRTHRISRRHQAVWLNSIHRVHAITKPPFTMVLRSVIWKIEGKTPNGKTYQKQLRLDMPV
ncbi:MAG: hypothetical protein H0X33_03190 [Taibaiella sp.]|nr:hypothetical protein [Taibaiella sp.]